MAQVYYVGIQGLKCGVDSDGYCIGACGPCNRTGFRLRAAVKALRLHKLFDQLWQEQGMSFRGKAGPALSCRRIAGSVLRTLANTFLAINML